MANDVCMPQGHFNNVIRMIKQSSLEQVAQLRHATFNTLKKLRLRRDVEKAVKGIPNGSNQTDLMSVFCWMDKVQRFNEDATSQIIAIDATCVARMEG